MNAGSEMTAKMNGDRMERWSKSDLAAKTDHPILIAAVVRGLYLLPKNIKPMLVRDEASQGIRTYYLSQRWILFTNELNCGMLQTFYKGKLHNRLIASMIALHNSIQGDGIMRMTKTNE